MNKTIRSVLWGIALLAVLASLIRITSSLPNLNRIGKEKFYVKITNDSTNVDPLGKALQGPFAYAYHMPAYNDQGTEKTLYFTADKELRRDAYLRLHVGTSDNVTAWEEVQMNELPPAARQHLETQTPTAANAPTEQIPRK